MQSGNSEAQGPHGYERTPEASREAAVPARGPPIQHHPASERNHIVVDFGDDVHGVRQRLEEKSKLENRTISSIVREILKRTLIDW